MKQIAIIGSTASGKTALSIEMAQQTNSIILSLDSLSVYKEINIASAKPTLEERAGIKHFGIDEVYVNETFDVVEFLACYEKATSYAKAHEQNLIIVGGTGFYLKILKEGLSQGVGEDVPLEDSVSNTHALLLSLDKQYMQNIASNDSYRVQKAFSIYKKSGLTPTQYFEQNPKVPIAPDLKLFEIVWDREVLRKRIQLRTSLMIKEGIIDEVIFLEHKYGRTPNAMGAIGITETLDYLDGRINKKTLKEKIATNTSRLAKRQSTFNRGQFSNEQTTNIIENLNSDILKFFSI
jgi:tRNA dimethylallyltransferase